MNTTTLTSQNTDAGPALVEALNAGILALNTLQNPDATTPADADQLDAITDAALGVLVRFRDGLTAASPDVCDECGAVDNAEPSTVGPWHLESCSAYAVGTDPADAPWTVIGFYDGDPEPLILAVVPGHVEVADGDTTLDWFADPVTALDATEATAVALADRAEE